MQSIDKFKLEINKLLKEEFDNTELKKSLNESFASKNLNLRTIPLLFEGKKFVEQLNDYELIAFCKGAYNIFRSNKWFYYICYIKSVMRYTFTCTN